MTPLTVYLFLAIIAFVVVMLLLVLGLEDFGPDADPDSAGGIDGGWDGPSPFSPIFGAIFLGSYGVTGIALELATDLSTPVVAATASLGGFPIYLLSYLGFRQYFGSSTGVVTDVGIVGRSALCTVPISPAGMGEIRVMDGATERCFAAKSARAVAQNESVRIASHHGSFVTVE